MYQCPKCGRTCHDLADTLSSLLVDILTLEQTDPIEMALDEWERRCRKFLLGQKVHWASCGGCGWSGKRPYASHEYSEVHDLLKNR